MKVVDERSSSSLKRLQAFSFEDFLEACCRLAVQKAWPADDVLIASGCADAMHYLAQLKMNDNKAYTKLLLSRQNAGSEPMLPTIDCVQHLILSLIRVIEEGIGTSGSQLNGQVSVKEAREFKIRASSGLLAKSK